MRRWYRLCLSLFITLVLSVALFSCSAPSLKNRSDAPYIMCTTEILEDVVSFIAADQFQVEALIRGNMDPHSYELVKGEAERLDSAVCIFASGLGLEHGSSLAYFLHKNGKVVSLGERVWQTQADEFIVIDGVVDPHFWMDVPLFAHVIEPIAEKLSELAPEKASLFHERAKKLQAQFHQLDRECLSSIERVPLHNRYLVTSHDAFNYFVRRYLAGGDTHWQSRVMAPQGLAPEAEISLLDLQKVCNFMVEKKVGVLFTEQNVSSEAHRKVKEICSKRGHKTRLAKQALFGDTLDKTHPKAHSYFGMVRYNIELVAKELASKECSDGV